MDGKTSTGKFRIKSITPDIGWQCLRLEYRRENFVHHTNRVVIATKVGLELAPTKKGLSKNYILRAVEDSLTRLQTDYIDLYQSHRDDPETSLQETLEAHAQLIQQGKVRAIGASNYCALQPLYNFYDRQEFETNLAPLCAAHGLGVIPYYSLARGFLTGK
jgi:aryl-alcohol dehydrogenase-like predicted oxidoreductase